jgi:phosphoribosylformylglycinamidine synthase I
VVQFPGSNCDQDALYALRESGASSEYVWHDEPIPPRFDAVFLPGGFTFGDYLRCGAIARFSPVMESVVEMARAGLPVLGVCNGFQVLCESGLLPGALVRNAGQRFVCRDVWLRVESSGSIVTRGVEPGAVLRMPIAHGEGCYVLPEGVQPNVLFRYCTPEGELTPEANPNGSQDNIAGVCNDAGNVVGMMPHPERAYSELLGSSDGRVLLQQLLAGPAAAPA